MIPLITEFTARNDSSFEVAYHRACADASHLRNVEIADVRTLAIQVHAMVNLAMYAAHHKQIESPACALALRELSTRQHRDIRLSLGVAAVGDKKGKVANRVYDAMGVQPSGASRAVEGVKDIEALYESILQWLIDAIDVRRANGLLGTTSAESQQVDLRANLPSTRREASSLTPRMRPML